MAISPQIEVAVLKTVKVSDDGISNRTITAGTTDMVPEDAVDGLIAEGYVAKLGETVAAGAEHLETREFAAEETIAAVAAGLDVRKDKFGRWAVYRDGVRATKSGSEDAARAALAGML